MIKHNNISTEGTFVIVSPTTSFQVYDCLVFVSEKPVQHSENARKFGKSKFFSLWPKINEWKFIVCL